MATFSTLLPSHDCDKCDNDELLVYLESGQPCVLLLEETTTAYANYYLETAISLGDIGLQVRRDNDVFKITFVCGIYC